MAISWLADVLRGAGVQVVEEGDWMARSAGSGFAPIGVLWHHTAAPSSATNPAPALNVCINGRADLPGPLCQALVDHHGVFHVISGNRANHAGASRGSGPIPSGDGNTLMIGWEIDYAGDGGGGQVQEMTQAQYDASVAATAAVLAHLGRDASHARGHRETSTSGKIDPSFIDLDAMRADVALAMGGTPPEPPAGTPFQTWVSNVNVRPTPDTSGAPVGQLAAPTTVHVVCEAVGETVTAEGYTNDRWARISSPVAGYISNIFIQGPAQLPVAACPV
ncbi:peptidoglycan recognition protein family protein [Nocardioides dongxiaopingii]|uniref:peptidoglycan recognition protein family protein n=1 Tax=Nocardioides TaxID=1839 RepID=UPI001BAEF07D|nr:MULTISPECIES: N-acetylmuramoyl-L-alanine amidase [Nocardioides]